MVLTNVCRTTQAFRRIGVAALKFSLGPNSIDFSKMTRYKTR